MRTTITLDEPYFRIALARARPKGITPKAYIQSLIEKDQPTLAEIVAPLGQQFADLPDDKFDALFQSANKWARKRMKTKK